MKRKTRRKSIFFCEFSYGGVFPKISHKFGFNHSVAFRITLLVCFFAGMAFGRDSNSIGLRDPYLRQQKVERLAQESQQKKAAAWAIAESQGWAPKEEINDTVFELMAIEGGRVYVYKTCNVDAAISIGVDQIRNTVPYNLNGEGITIGMWDSGAVRTTHQELVGRINVMDGAANSNHSTHVGGTIGASGYNVSALGMAPSIRIDSYNWSNDASEMISRAMSYPCEPGKIQVSNHSYAPTTGWENSYSPSRWYGTWGDRESDNFGRYDSETMSWDELCYDAPYYLPFKSAGNDRNDNAPADGENFKYYNNGIWQTKKYNSNKDPYSDGWDNGGFDTIPTMGVCKNIMTVGAVYDAVMGGVRNVTWGTMTTFSGWGPTDDGRIKPDIVANGSAVYSSIADNDGSYATYSGTSMSSSSAAGAASLLVQYYGNLFPGQAMRASTLKALIIHTADDLGSTGPDYKFGWGLMNAEAAADQIQEHYNSPDANKIKEDVLDSINPVRTYSFDWDGNSPIRATLCWTDPPAAPVSGLDNPSLRLINDLDLRIVDPNGVVYYPYILNPSSPADVATTGDNIRDNVEQVVISSPSIHGSYTVQISHKGTLTLGQQYYSLILSGLRLLEETGEPLLGDFNGDGKVDYYDLERLAYYWLQNEPTVDIAPAGGDGIINFLDYAIFAGNWGLSGS